MTQGIYLENEGWIKVLALAQLDDAIENRLPILVARKIVVSDEKVVDSLSGVCTDDLLDVVRGAISRFSALDIDYGAEAALERTAASGVETCEIGDGAMNPFRRQYRYIRAGKVGCVAQMVIDRL